MIGSICLSACVIHFPIVTLIPIVYKLNSIDWLHFFMAGLKSSSVWSIIHVLDFQFIF